MPPLPHPRRFVLVSRVSWMNQQQHDVIDYLQEAIAAGFKVSP
jgi:hypothetical protein